MIVGLVALTLVFAVADWWAVHTENKQLEYIAKPATMIPLIALAAVIDAPGGSVRMLFIVALVFSLAGDIFLMLPNEKLFVAGLGSFLLGHIAYVAGMWDAGVGLWGVVIGVVITATALGAIGPTLISGARDEDKLLGVPVFLYMTVISVMVSFAIGSGIVIAIVGALLFYLSDFLIGWSRFVQDFRAARLSIMVTYHLAQLCLVLSLAAH